MKVIHPAKRKRRKIVSDQVCGKVSIGTGSSNAFSSGMLWAGVVMVSGARTAGADTFIPVELMVRVVLFSDESSVPASVNTFFNTRL